ncbi:MAG: PQQ-dependent sugar dehydrogenase [Hyphomicrobiaceae bacterium]|nr:PQQ-dependent sugar dehydrogenase [Hyphomicrobiaceae bacterium]
MLRPAITALSTLLLVSPAAAEQTNAPAPTTPSKVKVETIAEGLANPWGLQFLPDGRALITEKPGTLRIVGKDGSKSDAIAGPPKVVDIDQGGLLDVRLAPNFATSGTIYLSYAEARDGNKNGTSVASAKLVLDGKGGKLDDVKVIFRQEPAYASGYHFGSRIVIANDGTLFVTLGERNFLRAESQNPANHIGKVVHINADGSPAANNPKLPGWAPEVWSIGHRNIQGAALDPATGELWTVEHGAKGGDELNTPKAGKNYGWPIITYGVDYSGAKIGEGKAKEGMEQAVYYWVPSIATSGLTFYTGDLFPEWKGNLFVGGLKATQLQRLVLKDGAVVAAEVLLKDEGDRIRDVRQGPDGALWLLTDDQDGKLLRLSPG